MTKKNIVIVGYPKSGTTWLSRLVAELVSCPLQGDWGFEDLETPNKEGLERESEFQVYKSHHIFDEIENASKLEIDKIIYIVRDPRDVVISGIHYFSFLPKLFAERRNKQKINQVLRKTYNRLISKKEKKRQMIDTVFNGNKKMNLWLSLSWKEHFSSYLDKGILLIKYEELIDSPEIECQKILKHLEITKDIEHINISINRQSFQLRKLESIKTNNKQLKKILRSGSYGYWKNELTEKEIKLFIKNFKGLDLPYKF